MPSRIPSTASVKIPADLAHPQPINSGCNTGNFHLARGQLDKEQDDKPLQPSPGPHFHGEEIRSHDQFPMLGSETPSRWSSDSAPALARCRAAPESPRSCCGPSRAPHSTMRPGSADSPSRGSPLPFEPPKSRSLRRCEVAPAGGCWLPSYFWAISLRCQASKVSGVTMVATSARIFRPNPLAFAANRRRWSSLSRSRCAAELLAKNPVLLAKIIDDLQLALVHPPGDGDHHEPERIQDSRHIVRSIIAEPQAAQGEPAPIQADPVFGPYDVYGAWRPRCDTSRGTATSPHRQRAKARRAGDRNFRAHRAQRKPNSGRVARASIS